MKIKPFYLIGIMILLVSILGVSSSLVPDNNWYNLYEQKTIYKDVMKETCIEEWYQASNNTLHPERCYETLDYQVPEQKSTGKVIGITNGEEIIYNAYIRGNKISKWKVPLGDRNFEEFGECLPHEIQKGVCEIVK